MTAYGSLPSKKSVSVLGIFLVILLSIQLLRNQSFDSHLDLASNAVAYYTQQLCAGIINANTSQIVTAAQRASSASFVSSVSVAQVSFGIQTYLDTKTYSTSTLIPALIRTSAIWFIFCLLSIFGWLSYCYSCTCPNHCPCCKKCRRDVNEKKYTPAELIVPSIFSILFGLLIIGVGVAGLTFASQVATGIVTMRCAFMSAFSEILQPANTSSPFPGLIGIIGRLNLLETNLNGFITNTTNTFVGKTAGLKTPINSVINNLEGYSTSVIYPQSSNQVSGAYPSYYANNQNLFSFITKSSSDNIQIGTASAQQFKSAGLSPEQIVLNTYYTGIITLVKAFEDATTSLLKSASFTSLLDSGIAAANAMVADIQTQGTNIYNLTQPMQTYSGTITLALTVIYSCSIAFAGTVVIGILILLIFKKFSARGLVHLGWCFYCLMMTIGFLLGAVLNPISVASVEFCTYLNGFLTNETFFLATNIVPAGQTKNILDECFFKAGNITNLIGLTPAIASISALAAQITSFNNQLLTLNITTQQAVIQAQVASDTAILKTVNDGSYTDEDPSLTASPSVQYQLTTFNAQKGTTGCIELGQLTCSDGTTPSRTSTSSHCWHISLLVSTGTSYSYCSAQSSLVPNLVAWFKQQSQYWSPIVANQVSTQTASLTVDQLFFAYIASIQVYANNTNAFLAAELDPNTGLFAGITCLTLGPIFSRIYDAFCVLFVPAAYRSTVLIILISMAMFFGSLSSFCVGLRFFKMSTLDPNQPTKSAINPEYDAEMEKLKQNNNYGNQQP